MFNGIRKIILNIVAIKCMLYVSINNIDALLGISLIEMDGYLNFEYQITLAYSKCDLIQDLCNNNNNGYF